MTEWRLIDSGPCPASYNMALDEAIATEVRQGNAPATLRFYGWEIPAVSLGCFQKAAGVNLGFCRDRNIPVVRRPTGGRAILHSDELTYSFCAPNLGLFSGGLLDTYRKLSSALKAALESLGIEVTVKTERETVKNLTRSPLCFKSTSYGEVSLDGRKLIGSAQKRWKDGFLQQGSLPYTIDEERTRQIFNLETFSSVSDGMIGLKGAAPDLDPGLLKEIIAVSFEKTFGISLRSSGPSRGESRLARELEALKYASPDWNLQKV